MHAPETVFALRHCAMFYTMSEEFHVCEVMSRAVQLCALYSAGLAHTLSSSSGFVSPLGPLFDYHLYSHHCYHYHHRYFHHCCQYQYQYYHQQPFIRRHSPGASSNHPPLPYTAITSHHEARQHQVQHRHRHHDQPSSSIGAAPAAGVLLPHGILGLGSPSLYHRPVRGRL